MSIHRRRSESEADGRTTSCDRNGSKRKKEPTATSGYCICQPMVLKKSITEEVQHHQLQHKLWYRSMIGATSKDAECYFGRCRRSKWNKIGWGYRIKTKLKVKDKNQKIVTSNHAIVRVC